MSNQIDLALRVAEIEDVKVVYKKRRKRYVIIHRLPHTFHFEMSEGLGTKGYLQIMNKNKKNIAKFKAGTKEKTMIW